MPHKCPHERIQYCPLYVAAHCAGLPTCIGDNLYDGCDVTQGKRDYGGILSKLVKANPGIVEECAEAEWLANRAEQRARNMRRAGLH